MAGLYDRLEAAIRKDNPELDEDGVYEALSEINESRFHIRLIQWIQMRKSELN
jgi:hypothetical protein